MGFFTLRLTIPSLILCLLATQSFASEDDQVESSSTAQNLSCEWIDVDQKCPDSNIRFYLYTQSNFDDKELIFIDDSRESSNLSSSSFNKNHETKIIIHGFRDDMFLTPLYDMKNEYLNRSNYNIFFVDWYNISNVQVLCYPAVVHNIQHVGKCVAQLVDRIKEVSNSKVHVIGFSLGAQVANYIANNLPYKLSRITGIDPAFPLFVMKDKQHKLDPSDAHFVDVYHCNALMQGQLATCGSVDFYMNGGFVQAGCEDLPCSHNRCPYYFTESIRSDVGFYARKCPNLFSIIIGLCRETRDIPKEYKAGEDCDTSTRGVFTVKTNSKAPFAKGHIISEKQYRLYNTENENSLYDLEIYIKN